MKKIKKPVSVLIALMMVISLFTIVPITANAETYSSGSNVNYSACNVGDIFEPGATLTNNTNNVITLNGLDDDISPGEPYVFSEKYRLTSKSSTSATFTLLVLQTTEITKEPVLITPINYDGAAKSVIKSGASVSGGQTVYYGVSSSASSQPSSWYTNYGSVTVTNIGTYYVWIKADGNENYKPLSPTRLSSTVTVTDQDVIAITYYEKGVKKTANAKLLNPSNDDRTIQSGWYYTNDNQVIFPCAVIGEVNIILTDGAVVSFYDSLKLTEGNTLNVYGQSSGTGVLYARSNKHTDAAIGGGYEENFGTLNVYGGKIKAENFGSQAFAAAIGGGYSGSGGTINIYGGSVIADAGQTGFGAGIGSGGCLTSPNNITGGNISIYGGTVESTGGTRSAAGIGGGYQCSGGKIAIYGGNVTATGGSDQCQQLKNKRHYSQISNIIFVQIAN